MRARPFPPSPEHNPRAGAGAKDGAAERARAGAAHIAEARADDVPPDHAQHGLRQDGDDQHDKDPAAAQSLPALPAIRHEDVQPDAPQTGPPRPETAQPDAPPPGPPERRPSPRAAALFPGLVSLLALLLVWTVAAALTDQPQRLPSPLLVGQRMAEIASSGALFFHAGMTLYRVAVAFVAAMILGGALGLWMGRSPSADRWLNPSLVVLLNIPALVVIVLAYIWIGLNETAAILAVALNKIPVVAVLLREAARALRPDLDDMAQVFAMSPVARLRHVVLPQLAPAIAAAARSGIALIWKIVLVVEFLGRSNGVGFMIHLNFSNFDVARVLAWSLAFVAVMLVIDAGVLRPWQARANRWRHDAA